MIKTKSQNRGLCFVLQNFTNVVINCWRFAKVRYSDWKNKNRQWNGFHTHSAGGIRASIKGSMSALPGTPTVNPWDSGFSNPHKWDKRGNAHHTQHSHFSLTLQNKQGRKREREKRKNRERGRLGMRSSGRGWWSTYGGPGMATGAKFGIF